jgi:hypothetical protein
MRALGLRQPISPLKTCMYDGFAQFHQFHQFHLEGLGYRGIKFGEALDFYQTDISIEGPNPVLPSGGNIGSGRSRFWMHTDCIQQLQGRAGARQVTGVKPEIAVSGGPMPLAATLSCGAPRLTKANGGLLVSRRRGFPSDLLDR